MRVRWGAIAAFGIVLVAAVLLGWLWRPLGVPEADPTPTPTEAPSIFEADAGSCVAEFDDAWQLEFDLVDCAEPHGAEVIGTVDATEYVEGAEAGAPEASASTSASGAATSWPGDEELASWAVLACEGLEGYDAAEITELQVRWPLQEDWDAGERTYVCFSVTPATATPAPTESATP